MTDSVSPAAESSVPKQSVVPAYYDPKAYDQIAEEIEKMEWSDEEKNSAAVFLGHPHNYVLLRLVLCTGDGRREGLLKEVLKAKGNNERSYNNNNDNNSKKSKDETDSTTHWRNQNKMELKNIQMSHLLVGVCSIGFVLCFIAVGLLIWMKWDVPTFQELGGLIVRILMLISTMVVMWISFEPSEIAGGGGNI